MDAVQIALEEYKLVRSNWRDTQRVAEQRFNFSLVVVSAGVAASGLLLKKDGSLSNSRYAVLGWGWSAITLFMIAVLVRLVASRRSIVRYIRQVNQLRGYLVAAAADEMYSAVSPKYTEPKRRVISGGSLVGLAVFVMSLVLATAIAFGGAAASWSTAVITTRAVASGVVAFGLGSAYQWRSWE